MFGKPFQQVFGLCVQRENLRGILHGISTPNFV